MSSFQTYETSTLLSLVLINLKSNIRNETKTDILKLNIPKVK